jgi:recombination protein RecA
MVEKKKALEMALAQIEKQFGKGSVMKLGDNSRMNIETISTGSVGLDLALGIGGVPRGRIVEIYGPESSGKTTVALHMIAEAQKAGGEAAFIDAEHALDPNYAKNLGVDTDNLIVSQPDTGEQALEICEALVRSGAIDIIVIDSVAALVPKAEIDGEMGDAHIGLQARLMSQALRKLAGVVSKSRTTAIFINQLISKDTGLSVPDNVSFNPVSGRTNKGADTRVKFISFAKTFSKLSLINLIAMFVSRRFI